MNIRKNQICRSIFLIFFLSSTLLFGQGSNTIIILHTNDMHSKIDNFGKLVYLADSLKKYNPYVFVVSSGDNFTGNPVVDMISEPGKPMIALMNRAGFTVSAIGNHEFDMGQPMLNKRIAEADFPFISCNIESENAVLKQPSPYFVVNAGNIASIAFLSAIERNENGIPDTHPLKVAGIRFTDGIETMKKYEDLKNRYGILIALTHFGVQEDMKLAQAMPGIDMIMGGHSHTLIDSVMIVNGVRITQAGSNMNFVGKTTLIVENGKVQNILDEIIPVKSLTRSDPEVQKMIDGYNNVEEFRKVAGVALKPINGPDELGSLMTDAVNEYMKTDFAFQNIGGIRSTAIDSGNITLKDIYKLDPFGNKVAVYRMTPEQIINLIRYGYELEKVPDLQVSGMRYTIQTDAEGNFIAADLFPFHEKKIDPGKKYLVSMNGYMSAAYKFNYSEKVTTSEETTAGILIKYLNTKKKVDYSGVKRVSMSVQK